MRSWRDWSWADGNFWDSGVQPQHADIGRGTLDQRRSVRPRFFLPAATTTTPVRHRLQCADIRTGYQFFE